MVKGSNLISETIMYSLNSDGRVVTHHLPWSRASSQLEYYVTKGLTFERPKEVLSVAILREAEQIIAQTEPEPSLTIQVVVPCPVCKRPCKPQGLKSHMRIHKEQGEPKG